MTIVEALKKFYEGNAHDEQGLKEADSVLDAIRAKYGPYEGANIAEYLQTAIANGVSPSSGGSIIMPKFTMNISDEYFGGTQKSGVKNESDSIEVTCNVSFDECLKFGLTNGYMQDNAFVFVALGIMHSPFMEEDDCYPIRCCIIPENEIGTAADSYGVIFPNTIKKAIFIEFSSIGFIFANDEVIYIPEDFNSDNNNPIIK